MEPSLHFTRANKEPSMHFRKANTELFMHFEKENKEFNTSSGKNFCQNAFS